MWQFIAIRVMQGIFTLLVISLLVFLATRLTGDPALVLLPPEASSKTDYERVRKQLGLDKSLSEQYFIFLRGAVQGDFGLSIRDRRPTRDLLLERLPATLKLAAAGMALAIIIGVPLGILSAVKRDSVFDKTGKLFAVLGMAAPQFWVAIMLILLFGAILKVLPTYGLEGPENYILPSFVLAWSIMAGIMRLGRSSMLEVLDSDYVRFARIKGLQDGLVVWKHALRNALIPIMTFSGISLAGLLNGAIVVEQVFAVPGLGRLMLDGVLQRNFPVVQAAVMASAFFYILTALVVDILYVYADPRIRH
ncbi:MAG: ABC transporter permease [Chloroflexi bacterium]|nr:ABC transporter permease [Chloroflexota bacterium]MYD46969.1 ABC transporter permease [Chloroflexota bacterium]